MNRPYDHNYLLPDNSVKGTFVQLGREALEEGISLGARCRTKRKGDFSREKSPSLSDFLKLWFGFQITT